MNGSAVHSRAKSLLLGLILVAVSSPRRAEAAPVIEYFQSSTDVVASAQPVRLWWRVHDAARVEIYDSDRQQTIAGLVAEGSTDVYPQETTIYTLIVYGLDGQVLTRAVTVTVGQRPGPEIVDFHATIQPVLRGSVVTLWWKVENAVRVDVFDGSTGLLYTQLAPEASMLIRPLSTSTYTLYAYGPDGQVVARQLTITFH